MANFGDTCWSEIPISNRSHGEHFLLNHSPVREAHALTCSVEHIDHWNGGCAIGGALRECPDYDPSPSAAGFGWREGVPLQLVVKSSFVQKELGLSSDAIEKVTDLQAKIDKEMTLEIEKVDEEAGLKPGGWSLLSKEQQADLRIKKQEASRRVTRRYENRVNELLTNEQQMRLHQIHLQAAGMAALSDSAVAQALRLSDEQRKQIADLYPQTVSAFVSRLKGLPQKAPFAFSPFDLKPSKTSRTLVIELCLRFSTMIRRKPSTA